MSDVNSAYWIVSHTVPINGGVDTQTDVYNLILAEYDLDAVQLRSGHVLHFVYVSDVDRDGLGARAEFVLGTDPEDRDTDDDGCSDSSRSAMYHWELSSTSTTVGTRFICN